jgi:Ca2+-binding EF-hand superfamily protein
MEGNQIAEETDARRRITKRRLLSIPSIRRNPVAELLLSSFTADGELKFEEMMEELRAFVSAGPLEGKLMLLFRIYDRRRMGHIDSNDLFSILKRFNNQGLEDYKIRNIVDKTYAELGAYRSEMDYGEFKSLILGKTKNLEAFFKAHER